MIPANLFEHIEIQSVNLAGIFQDRNELSRGDSAVLRIHPPDQCFAAAYRPGHRADDGLIIDLDPSVFQCLLEIPHDVVLEGSFPDHTLVEPEESGGACFRNEPACHSGPVTGFGQPGAVIVERKYPHLDRQVFSPFLMLHLQKEFMKPGFDVLIFCIDNEMIIFEAGGILCAEIIPDQLRQLTDLSVSRPETEPAVIHFQIAQIEIQNDRNLPLLPDLLNARHGIAQEMGHVLQSRQFVIVLRKFRAPGGRPPV